MARRIAVKKKIETYEKVARLHNDNDVYAKYTEDIIRINLLQTLTDSIYELYVNLGKHIEEHYGIYQNTKQKRNYQKLQEYIEKINSCFVSISETVVKVKENSTEEEAEAISDLILNISDFNINYIKMFLIALVEANVEAFLSENSLLKPESQNSLDKLWNIFSEIGKNSKTFNTNFLEKPNVFDIVEVDQQYLNIVNSKNNNDNTNNNEEAR